MILSFSKPEFVERIKKGIKVHTIRRDKSNRWDVGKKIHFWFLNPRNTKGKILPFAFGTGIVDRVEEIRIDFYNIEDWQWDAVHIGDSISLRSQEELNAFAINDGFDNWEQMKLWFLNHSDDKEFYFGKLIFWKEFKEVK